IQDMQGCVVKQLLVKGKRHFLNPRSGEDETAEVIFMKDNERIEGVCLFSIHPLGIDLLSGTLKKLR
ncbi:hypothetical protein, partial [Escherichia coli]|uniref:hypothetical protein n=1 Tax=Escherichia coli TaxID=562 RepID=UPI001BDB78B3